MEMPCGRAVGRSDGSSLATPTTSPRAIRGATEQAMTKNLLVLLGLASLPLLGGCEDNGNPDDPAGTTPDDTGTGGWAATVRAVLPEEMVNAQVLVDGHGADCAGTTCEWTADEPGTYEVTASTDEVYFVTLTATVENDGDTVDLTWQKGGCTDSTWSVGDGECPEWVYGQYGCDLTGYLSGVEEEYSDIRGDVVMRSLDADGNNMMDAIVGGGDDSENLVGVISPLLGISGTVMFGQSEASDYWVSAVMSDGNCSDSTILVTNSFGDEFHMELER
ncbi:hypothetical protein A2348_00790 [Candidatus Uhrbacteria bacterium RIFOXYB12_FULL_58_10]|uniref:Uncharacterized protein n=1 Tax=Candidatus Uhrbacteria bacterium RIFOXYB2_FULL_57_15 TaxID=1802422 RepID=A0A1F7W6J5_9BACT|nr:MAG: hypothetical protein A2348_00790 [Candidatus Uhrbacteria bacterium RIFOXYB12_FULL_58_10]OGL97807.1 MAG: hypothetical protein A2304_03775 [Candidatus Uhrbacteria bacterium RIFOXYB2_FULL_57_15]